MSVVFINERGKRVEKTFDSPYLCRKFVIKLKHTSWSVSVSYPNFN